MSYVYVTVNEEVNGLERTLKHGFTTQNAARVYLEREEIVTGLMFCEETDDWCYYRTPEGVICWSIVRLSLIA